MSYLQDDDVISLGYHQWPSDRLWVDVLLAAVTCAL